MIKKSVKLEIYEKYKKNYYLIIDGMKKLFKIFLNNFVLFLNGSIYLLKCNWKKKLFEKIHKKLSYYNLR